MSRLPARLLPARDHGVSAGMSAAFGFLLVLAAAAVWALGAAGDRVAAATRSRATIAIVSADPARLAAAEREVRDRLDRLGVPIVSPTQREGIARLIDIAVESPAELDRLTSATAPVPEASIRSQDEAVAPLSAMLSRMRLAAGAGMAVAVAGIGAATALAVRGIMAAHDATIGLVRDLGAGDRLVIRALVPGAVGRTSFGAGAGGGIAAIGLAAIGLPPGWDAPGSPPVAFALAMVIAVPLSALAGAMIAAGLVLRRTR